MSQKEQPELICGVEKELVEELLSLIARNYEKVDKATFFLEERAGVSNVSGIANVRDVVSHIVTLLDTSLDYEERKAQVTNAEEHLRRAVIEPYQHALNILIREGIHPNYDEYRKFVLPNKAHRIFRGAPEINSVDATLKSISKLRKSGRAAKARNLWDEGWEQGVSDLIEAYDKASELNRLLENYLFRYHQHKESRRQRWISIWGIIMTITTFLLSMLVLTN